MSCTRTRGTRGPARGVLAARGMDGPRLRRGLLARLRLRADEAFGFDGDAQHVDQVPDVEVLRRLPRLVRTVEPLERDVVPGPVRRVVRPDEGLHHSALELGRGPDCVALAV